MLSLTVPVQFYRFDDNKGLIHCRRFACQQATGDAVLVLDSHVEVKPGFIEPLLKVVDKNYKAIAAPVFTFWDSFDKGFYFFDGQALGFDRYLTWISIPQSKDGSNFRTPAILGGAFVAKKKFLEEVDYFGRCMVGWGVENLEIGMKTWMCGGELLYVPCSRVLHYAAKRSPMFHGQRKKADHQYHNDGVLWKSFFPDDVLQDLDLVFGVNKHLESCQETIDANKEMLRKNQCIRDYSWMRRNLMPGIESFDGETLIAHTPTTAGQCLTMEKDKDGIQKLFLESCERPKSARNRVRLTKWGELRIYDRQCLDWGYDTIRFGSCHNQGGNQRTGYVTETGTIFDKSQGKWCLGFYSESSDKFLEKGPCDAHDVDDTHNTFVIVSFTFKTIFHTDLLASMN